jgi:hypothetical protein
MSKYNFSVKKAEKVDISAALPKDIEQIKDFSDLLVGEQLKVTNDCMFIFGVGKDGITDEMQSLVMVSKYVKFDGKKLSVPEIEMFPLDYLADVLEKLKGE